MPNLLFFRFVRVGDYVVSEPHEIINARVIKQRQPDQDLDRIVQNADFILGIGILLDAQIAGDCGLG